MIPLTHPVLQDYLRVARQRPIDGGDAHAFLYDRLAESGCGFVGEKNGPTLADACWWYAKGQDEDEPALRVALWVMDELLNGESMPRPIIVREMEPDFRVYQRFFRDDPDFYRDDVRVAAARSRAKPATFRDLRRRVLALYPEVEYRLSFRLDDGEIRLTRTSEELQTLIRWHLKCAGFRPDLECDRIYFSESSYWGYRQTLTAPQLIPPESTEIGFASNMDPGLGDRVAEQVTRERAIIIGGLERVGADPTDYRSSFRPALHTPDEYRRQNRLLALQRYLACTIDPEPTGQDLSAVDDMIQLHATAGHPNPYGIVEWLQSRGYRVERP